MELDFLTETLSLEWQQVPAETMTGLQVLKSERANFQSEHQKQEHEQRLEQARIEKLRHQKPTRGF